jgi:hypothetical protein
MTPSSSRRSRRTARIGYGSHRRPRNESSRHSSEDTDANSSRRSRRRRHRPARRRPSCRSSCSWAAPRSDRRRWRRRRTSMSSNRRGSRRSLLGRDILGAARSAAGRRLPCCTRGRNSPGCPRTFLLPACTTRSSRCISRRRIGRRSSRRRSRTSPRQARTAATRHTSQPPRWTYTRVSSTRPRTRRGLRHQGNRSLGGTSAWTSDRARIVPSSTRPRSRSARRSGRDRTRRLPSRLVERPLRRRRPARSRRSSRRRESSHRRRRPPAPLVTSEVDRARPPRPSGKRLPAPRPGRRTRTGGGL